MRELTQHNFHITYPEDIVWLYDNNYVKIWYEQELPITATLTIVHPNGTTQEIGYKSHQNFVLLDISTLLRSMFTNNISSYGCQLKCFVMNVLILTFDFSFQLLHGKSYTSRNHGSENTIYCYDFDELKKVEIFSPSSAMATINGSTFSLVRGFNALNLYNTINQTGTYNLCISPETSYPTTTITSLTPQYNGALVNLSFSTGAPEETSIQGGDIWGRKQTFPVCYTLHVTENCDNNSNFEIMYVNADGCTRFLMGKIVEEQSSAKADVYKKVFDNYANIGSNYAYQHENRVKIAFNDIAQNAYLYDILLSQEVRYKNYQGDFVDCRLATDKITVTNNDSDDYTLEFIISE